MPRNLDLRRAFAHPLWWVALALLAANDHLFKGAGVLPTALTGKLSDVVGLLVAPVLLAVLCGVRHRGGWIAAHLAVGAGFAAINLSPAIARAVEAASLATPFPWMITVDPTDLVTLPMLAVSAVVFGRWSARPVVLRPLVARAAVALGGLACVATSPPNERPPLAGPDAGFEESHGNLMLANRTADPITIRIRPLADDIELDCATVAQNPTAALAPDLFGEATVWSVEPDRGIPVSVRSNRCGAALLGGATGNRLVFVDPRFWPAQHNPTGGPLLAGEHVIDVGPEGAASHPTLFRAPIREADRPAPACQNPPVGAGLDWIRPFPTGTRRITGHTVSADGCHAIELLDPPRAQTDRWYLCAPGVPLHFDLDALIDLVGGETWLELRLADRTIALYQSPELPAELLVEAEPIEGCAPYRDDCDGYAEPLALRHGADAYVAGEHAELIDGRDLYLIRAERVAVVDPACHPTPRLGAHLEAVVITPREFAEEDAR